MRCDHEHDDGAYVLGALSPVERAAYERHLATCSFCREAVADIAVLPGLLGRLDPADFKRLLDPGTAPPESRNRMPDLLTAAQSARRRDRRRSRRMAAVLAAACLAIVAGLGAILWTARGAEPPRPGPAVAMTPVDASVPISATVSLTNTGGGTKIDLVCSYRKVSDSAKSYTVRLMAYGPDEETDQLGSWVAAPGREFRMPAATHFSSGYLSRLVLMRNDGKVLLAYDVP
jgi:hypothetical protein